MHILKLENARICDGLGRIDRKPCSVHGVWVNGERVVDENGLLAEPPMPGQVLREFT